MLTYAAARDALAEAILKDAAAHEAERYDEVGRRFDALVRLFPRDGAPEFAQLRVALTFWDAWIDARNGGWQSGGGISKVEWPVLARALVSDLAGDRKIADPKVRARFDVSGTGSFTDRVRTLTARLHEG